MTEKITEVIYNDNYRIIIEREGEKFVCAYIEIKLTNKLGEIFWAPTNKDMQPSYSGYRYVFGESTRLPIQVIYELLKNRVNKENMQ